MPVFYGYSFALRGIQTTVNGSANNYAFAPSGTWRYTGDTTYFVVNENDGATNFNGDGANNETVQAQERFGAVGQQTVFIDGIERQLIWDYTFTVTDGTTTWQVAVIDVDLNNDNDLNDGADASATDEDGYYLVFPDGMPPPNTDLTIGGITDNGELVPHVSLGGTVVCFASGMMIETPDGPRAIEMLGDGDLVLTADAGPQPILWTGCTTVAAIADLAPIVVTAGTLGNDADLVVSPQHAILLTDWRAELLFGQDEVLVRAKDLLCMDGVYRKTGGRVTYHHILLNQHNVVQAHGIWSETLYPGSVAMGAVGDAARAEIERLFPDLTGYGPMCAPCLKGYEAQLLAA
ncbi:Hint domain-containing protein [Tateyamaria omphalii]|uniref:Hint domain-containing protein n=1 Tax=Tateyamaria omphalii TaxID=299262 RepID=UPI001C9965B1|nr:Hint domain-containing protein [Tateyamaria omphalii]MBY5932273.1 Hint domain-containing protein [Tateyamaria omphalii]